MPILTSLAVDPAHPFPHISNVSLNLLVVIKDGDREAMARIKVPVTIPRFMEVPPTEGSEETPAPGVHEEIKLVRVEEVMAANLGELFPGKEILASYVFQVMRDADLVIEEDEASALLQAIEDELEGRWFGQSVRLVVTDSMPDTLREWLVEHLRVEANAVCAVPEPLGLGDLEELAHLDRGTCCTRPLRPRVPPEFRGSGSVFTVIRQGDILLYHPYDSFSPVVEFVWASATDPGVLAIKQTLYRVGANSPIVEACDEQTQVAVLVELAQSPLRLGAEHRVRPAPRSPGRARGLRRRGYEDARQDLPGRPPGEPE